ncbi:hypothetical protein KM043_012807 [Ampulex compressa]|nr:hypothetical protein KM043_012807 [Ampulex compressa]
MPAETPEVGTGCGDEQPRKLPKLSRESRYLSVSRGPTVRKSCLPRIFQAHVCRFCRRTCAFHDITRGFDNSPVSLTFLYKLSFQSAPITILRKCIADIRDNYTREQSVMGHREMRAIFKRDT